MFVNFTVFHIKNYRTLLKPISSMSFNMALEFCDVKWAIFNVNVDYQYVLKGLLLMKESLSIL